MEIGARVRYIRIDNEEDKATGWYPPAGTLGTIIEIDGQELFVKWDSGTEEGEWYCNRDDVEYIGKYPLNIVKCVRQHLYLDEDDASRDDEIDHMSPDEVFEIVCNWNGLIHYSERIKSWINDIYQTNI